MELANVSWKINIFHLNIAKAYTIDLSSNLRTPQRKNIKLVFSEREQNGTWTGTQRGLNGKETRRERELYGGWMKTHRERQRNGMWIADENWDESQRVNGNETATE